MILLAWITLIVLPCLVGAGIMTFIYRKKTEETLLFSDSCLLGMLIFMGIGEVAHLIGLFAKLTLTNTGVVFVVLSMIVTVVSFVFWGIRIRKKQRAFFLFSFGTELKWGAPFCFLVLLLGQLLFIYCRNPLVVSGDIIPETVRSFLAEDGIYKVLPLTGQVSEQGMPLRYTILGLPTIYALLSGGFGVDAELLVCHVIPVIVLLAAYLAFYRLALTLFGKQRSDRHFLFLLLVAMLLCVSDGAVYMDGFQALHGTYTGVAIRNLILIPYTISSALEGRWWKAVLCILAEACITWTFLGCGVCVLVTLGILFLEILAKRWSVIGKYVSIFGDEEETL